MAIDMKQVLKAAKVSDGAWGTQLDLLGCPAGYCREEWNLSHPELVLKVASSYVNAGSNVILSNTFSANIFTLEKHGLGDKVEALNQAGAQISKQAAGDKAWVFASVGPSSKMLCTEEITEDELFKAFLLQAKALKAGGADGIVCETFAELAEILVAVRAVKAAGLPVVASMTFDTGPDLKTMMGVAAGDAAEQLTKAGADAIGCNCGVGIDGYIKVAGTLRPAHGPADLGQAERRTAGGPGRQDSLPGRPGRVRQQDPPAAEGGCEFRWRLLRNQPSPHQQRCRSGGEGEEGLTIEIAGSLAVVIHLDSDLRPRAGARSKFLRQPKVALVPDESPSIDLLARPGEVIRELSVDTQPAPLSIQTVTEHDAAYGIRSTLAWLKSNGACQMRTRTLAALCMAGLLSLAAGCVPTVTVTADNNGQAVKTAVGSRLIVALSLERDHRL